MYYKEQDATVIPGDGMNIELDTGLILKPLDATLLLKKHPTRCEFWVSAVHSNSAIDKVIQGYALDASAHPLTIFNDRVRFTGDFVVADYCCKSAGDYYATHHHLNVGDRVCEFILKPRGAITADCLQKEQQLSDQAMKYRESQTAELCEFYDIA